MASKKKYQERLEALERGRQARRKRWQDRSDALIEKTANHKGKDIKLNLSEKELDKWATRATGISPSQGNTSDRKAGRTKGRYLKGKL